MKFRAQWNMLTVDLGRYRMMSHVTMDGIGKVHDGGTTRHGHDLAFRRKDVNRFRKQINLDVIPEFGSITCFLLDVE